MSMLYLAAVVSLTFVAYLIHDFYNEQLRTRLAPIRTDKKQALHRKKQE